MIGAHVEPDYVFRAPHRESGGLETKPAAVVKDFLALDVLEQARVHPAELIERVFERPFGLAAAAIRGAAAP